MREEERERFKGFESLYVLPLLVKDEVMGTFTVAGTPYSDICLVGGTAQQWHLFFLGAGKPSSAVCHRFGTGSPETPHSGGALVAARDPSFQTANAALWYGHVA
jgi:hypothetical protein